MGSNPPATSAAKGRRRPDSSGGEAAGQVDGAGGGGVRSDRRRHAAHHGHGRDPTGERGRPGAGQGVGAPAGEPDDAQPLGVEGVGHLGGVGGPVGHRIVGVRVG